MLIHLFHFNKCWAHGTCQAQGNIVENKDHTLAWRQSKEMTKGRKNTWEYSYFFCWALWYPTSKMVSNDTCFGYSPPCIICSHTVSGLVYETAASVLAPTSSSLICISNSRSWSSCSGGSQMSGCEQPCGEELKPPATRHWGIEACDNHWMNLEAQAFPAPLEHWEDCSPCWLNNLITILWEILNQKLHEIVNLCSSKLLNFRVICYTAIDN